MGKLKIKGDTKDAQQKIKQLAKDVKKLHDQAQKPIRPNAQFGRINTANRTNLKGFAVGGAISGLTHTAASKGIDLTSMAIEKFGLSLLRMGTGISGLNAKIEKYNEAIAVFQDPEKEALKRGDTLDAWDDQRRSHKSPTLAHEFANATTFRDVAGVQGQMVADKAQAYFDQLSAGGTIDDLKKNGQILDQLGLTYQDLLNNSTWQNLAKILKAYEVAAQDGMNELEPLFQQIFGSRNIGTIRKLVGQNWVGKAQKEEKEFEQSLPNEQVKKLLIETDKSEAIRREKEREELKQPLPEKITEGAQFELDTARLKTRALNGEGKAISLEAKEELGDLWGGVTGENGLFGQLKNFFLGGDEKEKEKEVIKPIQQPQQKQQQNIKTNEGAGMGTEKLSSTFSNGVTELSQQLKANSEATRKMTSAINNSKVSSSGSNGAAGSNYSVFV